MTSEEYRKALIEAHNYLFEIYVRGDDCYKMANALARIRGVVEDMAKNGGHVNDGIHENNMG